MPHYTVYVDDNFHYMDESERYRLGPLPRAEPKSRIRSSSLEVDDPACKFSAWTYANERCRELATKQEAEPAGP